MISSSRWLYIILLVISSLRMLSCAHGIRLENLPDTVSPETISQNLKKNSSLFSTMEGRADLIIESPEYSDRLSLNVYLHYPDSILVQIRGPFGMRVATFFMTSDTLLFYDRQNGEYYKGSFSAGTIKKFIMADMNFIEIIDFFSGFPLLSESASQWKKYSNEDYFLLRNEEIFYNEEYRIDRSGYFILQILRYNLQGKLLFEKTFRRFDLNNGIFLPKIVEYYNPEQQHKLTIAYRYKNINKPLKESVFDIKIPDSAKEIIF